MTLGFGSFDFALTGSAQDDTTEGRVTCDFVAVAYASAVGPRAVPLHSACGYFTTMFTSLPGTTMDFTPEPLNLIQGRGRLNTMPASRRY